MITEELKQAVMSEAFRFAKYATDKQKGNLDFSGLDPYSPHTCVWGMASSDSNCFGDEALDLMRKCAVPYSHSIYSASGDAYTTEAPLEETCFDEYAARTSYSAIEHYITQEGAKNENLIKFMKGETKTLEL